MNRFQQVATFNKSAAAFGVGDRVLVDGSEATITLVYCQGGAQVSADVVMDGGAEFCVPVSTLRRVVVRD